MEVAGIVVNKNGVPFDNQPPFYPSGIRLGTPAITTRGMEEAEMTKIGQWITKVIDVVKDEKLPDDKEKRSDSVKEFKKRADKNKKLLTIAAEVKTLTSKFPVP